MSEKSGLKTGFKELDTLIGDIKPGEVILLAGRPHMGKTNMAINITRNLMINHGAKVLFFSLEHREEQIVEQFGILDKHERDTTGEDFDSLKFCTFTHELIVNKTDIRKRYREHLESQFDCIVIDYIQLLERNACKHLKELARELDIPILVVSQIGRYCESRKDKMPILDDFKNQDSITNADLFRLYSKLSEYLNDNKLKNKIIVTNTWDEGRRIITNLADRGVRCVNIRNLTIFQMAMEVIKLRLLSFKILQPHKNQTLRRYSKGVANSGKN